MPENDIFAQYLQRLREEKLKASHGALLNDELEHARTLAFEAELVKRIAEALRVLDKDVPKFVREFLS